MRIATTIVLVLALVLICVSVFPITHPSMLMANANTPPAGRTGAPGDGGTCVNLGCHVGTGGVGGMVVVPTNGVLQYSPGATDTIGVVIADSTSTRWGFELTVLKDSDNSMAGSFNSLPNVNTLVQSSGGKSYISHTSNGASSPFDPTDGTYWTTPLHIGGGGWFFEWTAPPPGSGPVTFYVSGVGANGDGLAGAGDTTYTFALQLTEQGTPVREMTWGKIKQIYR